LTGTIAEPSHKTLAQDTVENLPGVTRVDNLLVVSGEQPAPHSDGWIGTKVKSALFFHRSVSCTGTTVSVTNGVVTLGGEAASLALKELTAEYAKDVENVVSVNNNMTVAAAPPAPDSTAAEKIDDASITAQVKASLLARHSTSAIKTKVQTADGVVTISGTAKNAAEIALVTKLATDIQGVASVINNMTIEVVAANPK
jgi:osmotically-inducible protein OsmY